MPVRDSNAIFLQVLTAQPVEGLPLEVDVYSAADYSTQLDTLQDAYDVSFLNSLNEEGTGQFKLNLNDPKATSVNLAKDNLIKIKVDGIYRGAFFIEEVDRVDISPDEGGGMEIVVQGRGPLAYLDRAVVYPVGWPTTSSVDTLISSKTRGKVISDLIILAQGRIPSAIPRLTYDFTPTVDSINDPWTDSITDTIKVGTSYFDLIKKYAAMGGFDLKMDTDLKLSAYNSREIDRSTTVVFTEGRHLAHDDLKKVTHNIDAKTRLLVLGQSGVVLEVSDPTYEAEAGIGRREGAMDYSSTSDVQTLSNAGVASLGHLELEAEPLQISVNHGDWATTGLYEPFVDYDVGDLIAIDALPDYDHTIYRIVGLTISQIEGGDFKVVLDLNAYYLDPLSALKNQVGNTGANTSGGGAAIISPGSSPDGGSSRGQVAIAPGDTPGWLINKLLAGTGIELDLIGGAPNEQLSIKNIGLTDPTTTFADLIVRGPSGLTRFGSGGAPNDNKVLTADSTQPTGWKLVAVTASLSGAIANNGGAPSIQEGTHAARPAAGNAGSIYIETDTFLIYRDTGSAWQLIGYVVGLVGDISSSAPGDAASAGASGRLADAAHEHAREAWGTGPADVASAAANGTGTTLPRIDHAHRGVSSWKVGAGGTVRYGGIGFTAGTNVTIVDNGDGTLTINASGGGASTLAGLTDVAIASPADGDLLQYVASASKWENKPLAAGALINTTYRARAYLGSGSQTVVPTFTYTVINLDTIDFDPNGNFSTSTHRYTVPATGLYRVSGRVGFSTAGDVLAVLQRVSGGTTTNLEVGNVASYVGNFGGNYSIFGEELWCVAGDTLALAVTVDTANTAIRNGGQSYLEVAYLGSAASQADNAWTNLTLLNSWINYGYFSPLRCRKDASGFVHISGAIKNGTTAASCAQLPTGYRPGYPCDFVDSRTSGGFFEIGTDGNIIVYPSGSGTGLRVLDGITFLAEN